MVREEAQQHKKLPMDAATYMKHVLAYQESYVCPACKGITRVPVKSPCDHVFCRSCYKTLTNISATAAKGASCPKCGEHWYHRPPMTSPLLQIALDTYFDFIRLHNQRAKLNGKKEEFVPESRIGDFAFPVQPPVLTQPTKPIYYGLKTPRRPAFLDQEVRRPVAVVGATRRRVRKPSRRANAQPESEAPAGRKRKANELRDTSVSVADSSGGDLAEWRRRSGLDVVAAFEQRIPGFTDLVGSSQDVQQLVDHFNNSLITTGAHATATVTQNEERPPAKKKRSGQKERPEEANDDNSLLNDTVNDAELMRVVKNAERALEMEMEKQTRVQSVVQDVHPVYPQIVSSPNVFDDLFGHQADAAPGEDHTDGQGTKSQEGDGEAIDDQGLNVDSGAFVQQVIVPDTQHLFQEPNQNAGQELQQEEDEFVQDSLEEDPFASSQSPVHQPFVLAQQNAQMIEQESVSQLPPSQMVICLSGIKERDPSVTEFKRVFGVGSMSRELTNAVTHIVVHTNAECDMPKEHRTYKYFWGIAAKKYVVSHLWLTASLNNGNGLLPEEGFEVRRDLVLSESCRPADYACRRARLQKSRIFAGYSFYLLSENAWMQTRFAKFLIFDQMLVLLEEAGALVVENPSQLPDTLDDQQNPMSYILFPFRSADVEDDMNRLSKRYRRQVMPADWVIDSIISNAVIQRERLDYSMPREARHSQ